MNSASLDLLRLITTLDEFDDSFVFENEEIPQSFLKSNTVPFIYIQALPVTANDYASGRRLRECQQIQVDLYSASNKQQLELVTKLNKLFDSQSYGCFFYEPGYDIERKLKRYTWRLSKLIYLN